LWCFPHDNILATGSCGKATFRVIPWALVCMLRRPAICIIVLCSSCPWCLHVSLACVGAVVRVCLQGWCLACGRTRLCSCAGVGCCSCCAALACVLDVVAGCVGGPFGWLVPPHRGVCLQVLRRSTVCLLACRCRQVVYRGLGPLTVSLCAVDGPPDCVFLWRRSSGFPLRDGSFCLEVSCLMPLRSCWCASACHLDWCLLTLLCLCMALGVCVREVCPKGPNAHVRWH
jgi:hypothetical protein